METRCVKPNRPIVEILHRLYNPLSGDFDPGSCPAGVCTKSADSCKVFCLEVCMPVEELPKGIKRGFCDLLTGSNMGV